MKKILLIGCGHMGEALLSSWINSNKYSIKLDIPPNLSNYLSSDILILEKKI